MSNYVVAVIVGSLLLATAQYFGLFRCANDLSARGFIHAKEDLFDSKGNLNEGGKYFL